MDKRDLPELMVPANNLNILKYAVEYGADAVYIGGKDFNLRSIRGNFSLNELKKGLKYAHKKRVKIYFTLNAIIGENEVERFKGYLKKLKGMDLKDVLVVSETPDENLYLASRNLYGVDVRDVEEIDPVSLVAYEHVLVTESAVKKLEERLA